MGSRARDSVVGGVNCTWQNCNSLYVFHKACVLLEPMRCGMYVMIAVDVEIGSSCKIHLVATALLILDKLEVIRRKPKFP
jgi:hypothetical protein